MCDPFCKHPAFLAKAILTLLGTLPTSVHLMSRSCPNSVIQSIQDNNPVVGQWICKSFCMDRQRYMQVANSNIWRNLAGNYYICKRHMWTTHWFNSNDCTWPHDYVTWHWDMYPDLLRPSLLKLQCFFSHQSTNQRHLQDQLEFDANCKCVCLLIHAAWSERHSWA